MQSTSGRLILKPTKADLKSDANLLLKASPYCIFELGSEKKSTHPCKRGGKSPTWDDVIEFDQSPGNNILFVQIWDKDRLTKDDLICEGSIPMEKLQKPGIYSIDLYSKKGVFNGKLLVETECAGTLAQSMPGRENIGMEQPYKTEGITQADWDKEWTGAEGPYTKKRVEVEEIHRIEEPKFEEKPIYEEKPVIQRIIIDQPLASEKRMEPKEPVEQPLIKERVEFEQVHRKKEPVHDEEPWESGIKEPRVETYTFDKPIKVEKVVYEEPKGYYEEPSMKGKCEAEEAYRKDRSVFENISQDKEMPNIEKLYIDKGTTGQLEREYPISEQTLETSEFKQKKF